MRSQPPDAGQARSRTPSFNTWSRTDKTGTKIRGPVMLGLLLLAGVGLPCLFVLHSLPRRGEGARGVRAKFLGQSAIRDAEQVSSVRNLSARARFNLPNGFDTSIETLSTSLSSSSSWVPRVFQKDVSPSPVDGTRKHSPTQADIEESSVQASLLADSKSAYLAHNFASAASTASRKVSSSPERFDASHCLSLETTAQKEEGMVPRVSARGSDQGIKTARQKFQAQSRAFAIVCGHPQGEFLAGVLFPERRTINSGCPHIPSRSDIMVVSGKCRAANRFPGKVLYWDAEQGRMSISPSNRVVYMGLPDPPFISGKARDELLDMVAIPVVSMLPLSWLYKSPGLSASARNYTWYNHNMTEANFLRTPRNGHNGSGRRFLVYAHYFCGAKHRQYAFDTLVVMARQHGFEEPVAMGYCNGTAQKWDRPDKDAKFFREQGRIYTMNPVIFSEFKFVLCMENTFLPGYVTEKILNCFLSGAVPIYWGTRDVFKIFNSRAFVYWDFRNQQRSIDQVIRLQTDADAYAAMVREPILAHGDKTVEEYFSLSDSIGGGKLKRIIRGALNQEEP